MQRARVDSVDLLRGVIMVIMMLDHTRDFVHSQGLLFDPTDVSRTWPLLFFTRWITHFCAPNFAFLAGTGAYLQELRGKPKSELSRFLITRGLWLILLEFTVLRVIIFFNFDYPVFMGFLQVIWVIGWGMIVLAGVIYLPLRVIIGLSVAMIVLHNSVDGIHATSWRGPGSPVPGFGASLWHVLHEPGIIFPFGYPGPALLVLYPLIPWIGVLAAGYAFGSIYRLDDATRRRLLFRLGGAITIGFIVLRAINIYGDPSRWSVQSSPVMTALSFLAVSKYPPSLLFLMMTLGPAMIFLGWFDGRGRAALGSMVAGAQRWRASSSSTAESPSFSTCCSGLWPTHWRSSRGASPENPSTICSPILRLPPRQPPARGSGSPWFMRSGSSALPSCTRFAAGTPG